MGYVLKNPDNEFGRKVWNVTERWGVDNVALTTLMGGGMSAVVLGIPLGVSCAPWGLFGLTPLALCIIFWVVWWINILCFSALLPTKEYYGSGHEFNKSKRTDRIEDYYAGLPKSERADLKPAYKNVIEVADRMHADTVEFKKGAKYIADRREAMKEAFYAWQSADVQRRRVGLPDNYDLELVQRLATEKKEIANELEKTNVELGLH